MILFSELDTCELDTCLLAGLGQMKNEYICYSKPESAIQIMGDLKKMFDPNLILNPNKYLPSSFWTEAHSLERSVAPE